jgi:hypothetical protein
MFNFSRLFVLARVPKNAAQIEFVGLCFTAFIFLTNIAFARNGPDVSNRLLFWLTGIVMYGGQLVGCNYWNRKIDNSFFCCRYFLFQGVGLLVFICLTLIFSAMNGIAGFFGLNLDGLFSGLQSVSYLFTFCLVPYLFFFLYKKY